MDNNVCIFSEDSFIRYRLAASVEKHKGFACHTFGKLEDLEAKLSVKKPEAAMLHLTEFAEGFEDMLERIREKNSQTIIILITDDPKAIKAFPRCFKAGADNIVASLDEALAYETLCRSILIREGGARMKSAEQIQKMNQRAKRAHDKLK